jgi:hypothetical protein
MLRAPATTCAPSSDNARVIASPMPLLAPRNDRDLVGELEIHEWPCRWDGPRNHHLFMSATLAGSKRAQYQRTMNEETFVGTGGLNIVCATSGRFRAALAPTHSFRRTCKAMPRYRGGPRQETPVPAPARFARRCDVHRVPRRKSARSPKCKATASR